MEKMDFNLAYVVLRVVYTKQTFNNVFLYRVYSKHLNLICSIFLSQTLPYVLMPFIRHEKKIEKTKIDS